MVIKRFVPSELKPAIDLVWSVFLEFEAPDYSEEGVNAFYESIQDPSFIEMLTFYCAYEDDNLIGVLATRHSGCHISLFFVKASYQRKGVGRKLFEAALKENTSGTLTVNSSPYAVDIYHKLGFVDAGREKTENGIRYTPMIYKKPIIRFADRNDIQKLIQVRFDYFSNEKFVIKDDQKEKITLQLREYYAAHLNQDFFAAFAEEDDGTIVSTAFLTVIEKPANLNFPTGKTGLILNVLTYPEHRRKGYATQVLNILIEEARKHNLSYMELSASESGKPLYQKLGFEEPNPNGFTPMKLSLM